MLRKTGKIVEAKVNFPNVLLVLCRGLIYYAKSKKGKLGPRRNAQQTQQSQESPPGVQPAINFNESAQNARKSA